MPERLNIILIVCDQFRWDCLSVLGHPVVRTPNLDELAHRGTLFPNAYSTCPSCVAARASLFTGLTPNHTGRLGYRDQVPWRYPHMLAQVLGDAGYQTHCVGKTHFYPQRAHCGFHGLETYEGEQNFDGRYVNDYYEWVHERSNGRLHERDHGLTSNSWAARPSALPEELHNNTWVVTRGLDFLHRRDGSRPFFLNLSFHRPHPPLDPPQVFWDMYANAPLPPLPIGDWAAPHAVPVTNLDAWHGDYAPWQMDQARRAYYAQIAHIDSQIGRLMRSLERGRVGPTAILFTSDHGEMLGDHHMFRKTYAYQGSAAVPMIVAVPGLGRNQQCRAATMLEDFYPTILDLAGVPLPQPVDGLSLVGACRGEPVAREVIHGEHSKCYSPDEAMQFLTDGREKYIWFTLSGREQMFDLERDPQERHDLARQPKAKARVARWRRRLIELLAARPQDGLTDGKQLLAGKLLPAIRPELEPAKA